jgi:hypothetical protein
MNAADVLLALVNFAPSIKDIICAFWGHCGEALNLGPLPPDLKADFAAVDREIDKERGK